MLHKRESLAGVVPCNNKPGAGTAQNREVAIMRTDYPWRCHGVLLSTEIIITGSRYHFKAQNYCLLRLRSSEMKMSVAGQNAKYSARANNFCFARANGHYQARTQRVGWSEAIPINFVFESDGSREGLNPSSYEPPDVVSGHVTAGRRQDQGRLAYGRLRVLHGRRRPGEGRDPYGEESPFRDGAKALSYNARRDGKIWRSASAYFAGSNTET